MNEKNDPTDITELTGDILTIEDFRDLELPKELPPYKGLGRTSFAEFDEKTDPDGLKNYDTQKREYLSALGIETPAEWLDSEGKIAKDNRALFVSMFIITGHILATEDMKRELIKAGYVEYEEVLQEVLHDTNMQILNHRLDTDGMRRKLPIGTMKETHYEKLKLSTNPEKRASLEELHMVTRYIFEQLNKPR